MSGLGNGKNVLIIVGECSKGVLKEAVPDGAAGRQHLGG